MASTFVVFCALHIFQAGFLFAANEGEILSRHHALGHTMQTNVISLKRKKKKKTETGNASPLSIEMALNNTVEMTLQSAN